MNEGDSPQGVAGKCQTSLLPVPRIDEAFTAAGEPTNPGFEKRSERFFREFEWYAEALRQARRSGVPY